MAFIIYDSDTGVIYGLGTNLSEAVQDALIWTEGDSRVAFAEHGSAQSRAAYLFLPASEALTARVRAGDPACGWYAVDGVATI